VNEQHNADHPVDPHAEQGVSRRSFIKLAGASGLALSTGCTGKPNGGAGWLPSQYEGTGNFPVQVRGRIPIDPNNPTIMRDDAKCILCGQCAEVCERYQAVMGNYELPLIDDIPCIGCGQCTLWCPTSSITEKDDTQRLFDALNDPNKHVVVQFAPSTRIGLGEEFGMPAGTNVEGKQIAALRALGFDTVLDTNFAADLTIMEEATELVQRLTKEGSSIPLFTSCCPGWVKFCEMFYPELIPHLSTARSPMGMLGPIIKTYYADQRSIKPENIVSVSVMPCTAKKFECSRPEMNNAGEHLEKPEIRDTDIVITTRELARMIKQKNIDFLALEDGKCDDVLSEYTGGGAIFGVTGGVMEAAVRTAYYFVTKENPPPAVVDLKPVRGLAGIKEAALEVPGFGEVRVAVVSGTANAKKVLEKVKDGTGNWHFMEFMACPGGCISGGGQPKTALPPSDAVRAPRTKSLYDLDEECPIRLSHENPQIKAIYKDYFEEPCGHLSHELLHTHGYTDRSMHFTAKK
jgi:iron-only hydrogenase group A